MDGILQLGPLMLATDRAIAVALLWAFVAIGGMLAHRYDVRAAKTAWLALVAGVVAARIGSLPATSPLSAKIRGRCSSSGREASRGG